MVPWEDGYNIPPDPSLVRYRQRVQGVLALEAPKGALHDGSTIFGAIPTSVRVHGCELIVTGRAHHVRTPGSSGHLEMHHGLFALPAQVRRMVDEAPPIVGGHWIQASGADTAAGLTVPAGLPVLLLVLPAAVVDAESK